MLQAAHQSAFLAVIVASGSLLGLLLQAALDLADLADGGSQQVTARWGVYGACASKGLSGCGSPSVCTTCKQYWLLKGRMNCLASIITRSEPIL